MPRRCRVPVLLMLPLVVAFATHASLPCASGGQDGPARLTEAQMAEVQELRSRIDRLLAQRNHRRAAALSEQLVERFPDSHVAWMTLANCHLQDNWPLRKDSRAEEAAARAVALIGRHPMILNALATAKFRQRRADAEEILTELLDLRPRPAVFDAGRVADLYVMRGRLRAERAPDPDSMAGARLDFAAALRAVPHHALGLMESAQLRLDDDQHAEALAELQRAQAVIPGNRTLHFLLFRCHRALGQRDEARHHQKVSSLLRRLTDSLAKTGAPGLEERIEIHRTLKELNPADRNRWYQLADMERESGDLERAEAEYAALREAYPTWSALDGLRQRIDEAKTGEASDDGEGEP